MTTFKLQRITEFGGTPYYELENGVGMFLPNEELETYAKQMDEELLMRLLFRYFLENDIPINTNTRITFDISKPNVVEVINEP